MENKIEVADKLIPEEVMVFCVMCRKQRATVRVFETNEPLCSRCYNNNLEARRQKSQ